MKKFKKKSKNGKNKILENNSVAINSTDIGHYTKGVFFFKLKMTNKIKMPKKANKPTNMYNKVVTILQSVASS